MDFKPLDPKFPIQKQMDQDVGTLVLINLFTMDPADELSFLEAWAKDAALMKSQPGYFSTQLHRAVGPSPTYVNYAVWESMEAYRNAFNDPRFHEQLKHYPPSVQGFPHLFQRVGVPGFCAA